MYAIIKGKRAEWDAAASLGSTCADCGGQIVDAPAGHVPYHGICEGCGSHWDAVPVGFFGEIVPDDRWRDEDFERHEAQQRRLPPIEVDLTRRRFTVRWVQRATYEDCPFSFKALLATAMKETPLREWWFPDGARAGDVDPRVCRTTWSRRARFY